MSVSDLLSEKDFMSVSCQDSQRLLLFFKKKNHLFLWLCQVLAASPRTLDPLSSLQHVGSLVANSVVACEI